MAENVASGYLPRYPDGGNPPDVAGIQSFITNFYQVSDDPKLNERWVDSFTEDATVQIGPDKVQGVEAIRNLRAKMWSVVQERQHRVIKVFPGQFNKDESECECMLVGEGTFKTKNGETIEPSWSGHAILKKEKGEWKLKAYRVWTQL